MLRLLARFYLRDAYTRASIDLNQKDIHIQHLSLGTPFHLNESAGLAQFGLAHTKVVAYLSESVCRARFKSAHKNASFAELLVTNAEHIAAAVSRRFASGAQPIFVLRPTDF